MSQGVQLTKGRRFHYGKKIKKTLKKENTGSWRWWIKRKKRKGKRGRGGGGGGGGEQKFILIFSQQARRR